MWNCNLCNSFLINNGFYHCNQVSISHQLGSHRVVADMAEVEVCRRFRELEALEEILIGDVTVHA